MFKLGTYLTIAFIVCNLYGSQANALHEDNCGLLKDPNLLLKKMLPLVDHVADYRSKNLIAEINLLKKKMTELTGTMTHILAEMKMGQASLQESLKDIVPKDLNDRLCRVEDQQVDIQKSLGAQLDVQINLENDQKSVLELVQSLDKKLADIHKSNSEYPNQM